MTIELLMNKIALMDSNNYSGNCGVGEREGRVYSDIVRVKNFGLGHGIGRSGDVNALQPKAIGSSLVVQLSRTMTLNMMQKVLGLPNIKDAIILPFATGMSITISLLTLKNESDKKGEDKKYVIFPRIDQKTCLKSIYTANLQPIVIEPIYDGDELKTNVEQIETVLKSPEYAGKVLCVLSTTSCFAPRVYDSVVEIAKICKNNEIKHVINSAYGL